MKFNWAWNCSTSSSQIFAASSILIGHEVSQLTLRSNTNLYSGTRNNVVFFNNTFLFLNYLKKGNFLKKLADTESEFIFTTGRSEFFFYIKRFAKKSNGGAVLFNKFMDLTTALNIENVKHIDVNSPENYFSKSDPIIFLFNNDNLGSRAIMKEIKLKNYFTVSSADSNSLNTNAGGFVSMYGNDDSASSINFYGKFLCYCLKRGHIAEEKKKKKKSFIEELKTHVSSENELYIIKQLLKKK